jgi:uncharacterized membrane-anchored protein YjiN (DUF445 family)
MKQFALALLGAAAVVFVVARFFEAKHAWLGYVRATAEAAMVGACADWFAVSALFRHPLGLKIPHTAIIPTRKDQIGESLGQFMQENFLSDEAVATRLHNAQIAERGAVWLSEPEHAQRMAGLTTNAVRGVMDVLSDDDVQELLDSAVASRIRSTPMAPLVAKVLDVMTESGRHHEVFEAAIRGVGNLLADQRDTFRQRLASESPWWVPESIDDRIFDKMLTGIQSFLADVSANPDHELRRYVDRRLQELVEELKTSPVMAARADAIVEDLIAHPAVRSWSASLWRDLKATVAAQSADPTSALHSRIARTLERSATALRGDPVLQAKIDTWITEAVTYLVQQYRGEVAELIASTVRTWDAREASDRIEQQIGRDLQFIRINGTIVGGLVGLIIYSVGQLFG